MKAVIKKCGGCGRDFESVLDNNFCQSCIDDDSDDEQREPDYWMCGCGRSVTNRLSASSGCPRCGSIMEEGYF